MNAVNGRVKWFNNKAGYGFLTISSGEKEGTDIFVHHKDIVVGSKQFKYLVDGEYVKFDCTDRGITMIDTNTRQLMLGARRWRKVDVRNTNRPYESTEEGSNNTSVERTTKQSTFTPYIRIRNLQVH